MPARKQMLKVAIADDEVLIRMNLQEMLEDGGYQVVGSYGDGLAAIEGCRRNRPDIALLDIRMPKLDGLAVSHYLVKNRLVKTVLLITAYDDIELVERAEESGVAGYLVKPVSERMLFPAIKIALARSRDIEELRDQKALAEEELEKRKLIERAKGVLMKTQNLSESEAYDYIRQLSRKNNISMKTVAESILGSPSVR